jgi:hypothetical protein
MTGKEGEERESGIILRNHSLHFPGRAGIQGKSWVRIERMSSQDSNRAPPERKSIMILNNADILQREYWKHRSALSMYIYFSHWK